MMEKKPHKISQLERLHMQKIRLQAEADTHWSTLDEHWDYLQNNLGSLVITSTINSVKSKLPPVIAGLIPFPEGGNTKVAKSPQPKTSGLSATAEMLLEVALDSIPFLFKGRKSIIIALVLKKIKNLFL